MSGLKWSSVVAVAVVSACAAAGPVERAGTLGIAYFGPLAPENSNWYTKGTADFNGDGHADAMGYEAWGDRIAVVLSTPDGYGTAVLLELCNCFGSGEPSMAAGDVDGDGRPEVLVADPTGRRVWAVPVVDGGFGQGWWISTGTVASVRFAFENLPDLDGDGRADLAFSSSGVLTVLPSADTGIFFARTTGVSSYLALTDLTGDGVPDAVTAVDGTLRVYPGGPQGFAESIEIQVPAGVVSVVDLDGDGAADLIGSDAALGEGWIRRNEGSGSFGSERRFPAIAPFSSLVSVGDLDGNGLPEVVGSVRPPGLMQSDPHLWQNPWSGDGLAEVGWLETPNRGRFSSRDLDGDGQDELVSLHVAAVTGFMSRRGVKPIVGTRLIDLEIDPLDIRAADLNSDGTPELVISHFTGVSVFSRQPDASYAESVLSSGTQMRFMSMPADMNGDGAKDLVVSASTEGIEIWPGSPDGLGVTPVRYTFDAPSRIRQLQVGDVNGDGLPDVVAADEEAGVVRVLFGSGAGFPTEQFAIPMTNPWTVAIADVDGDGASEIVASGEMVLKAFRWELIGWQTVAEVTLDVYAYWLTAADLDADGSDDLVVGNASAFASNLYVLYGGPAGVTNPTLIRRTSRGHAEIMANDINGDGQMDLIIAPYDPPLREGMALVLLQHGHRSFIDVGYLPGRGVGGIDAADLDNDGILDIVGVCHNASNDLIQIHANREAPCLPDLDQNGLLNFFDISGYLALYNAQDARADLASPFGVFNFFDISAYLSLYNAGCP